MKIEEAIRQRILRNVVLSLFIYILPIALMFGTFYVTGQRPWLKKQQQTKESIKSINKKSSTDNGSND